MKVRMRVVLELPDGDEKTDEITADARDVRRYEAEFDTSFLASDLSMTQLSQLAFVALRRLGRFTGSWDVFDAQCTEVEGIDDDVAPAPVRPTRRGRGGAS